MSQKSFWEKQTLKMSTSIISKDRIGEEIFLCHENESSSVIIIAFETICQMQYKLDQTELDTERCSPFPSLWSLSRLLETEGRRTEWSNYTQSGFKWRQSTRMGNSGSFCLERDLGLEEKMIMKMGSSFFFLINLIRIQNIKTLWWQNQAKYTEEISLRSPTEDGLLWRKLQLLRAPWLGMGLCAQFPFPCWELVWLGVAHFFCMQSRWLWVPLCSCPACPEDTGPV